jgi:hypothetical protein
VGAAFVFEEQEKVGVVEALILVVAKSAVFVLRVRVVAVL